MGRTGRKRQGKVVFLLTEGKEERDHRKSQETYEEIQQKIASGKEFVFNLENSPRILPNEYQPDCVKQQIIQPLETPDALELKVDRRKKAPKRERDWSLPENVETGFIRASTLGKRNRKQQSSEDELESVGYVDPESLRSPFLTKEDEDQVRKQRVRISPTSKRMNVLDTESAVSIPAGALRNRLVSTHKAMKDPTRSRRTYINLDLAEFKSTPPGLIGDETPQKTKSFELNTNMFLDDDSSSGDDLPDLSVESIFKGNSRVQTLTPNTNNSKSKIPNQVGMTPRKRIRIAELSDEE
jgi:hypothetical protein